jgi:succinyl-diaminopimelate desuccinylase
MNDLYKAFPQSDSLYRPAVSTFVPSKKDSNVENINTMPGLDVFYVDCRILPEVDVDEVLRKAEILAKEAVKPYNAGVRIETVYSDKAPAPTAVDAPVVQRLSRSLKKLRNIDPKPIGVGGRTVAAFLRAEGIPAAGWATASGSAHMPNEKSSIEDTLSDAKIILDMLFD